MLQNNLSWDQLWLRLCPGVFSPYPHFRRQSILWSTSRTRGYRSCIALFNSIFGQRNLSKCWDPKLVEFHQTWVKNEMPAEGTTQSSHQCCATSWWQYPVLVRTNAPSWGMWWEPLAVCPKTLVAKQNFNFYQILQNWFTSSLNMVKKPTTAWKPI